MERAGVTVDRSSSPASIAFEAGFNAAVPFIDRHVPEGRGGKVAIRTAAGEVTCAELAANVNRCGTALLRLGLEKGQRLLLVVKDCPELLYLFRGAIEAGVIPVPLHTIPRAADYEGIIRDSACIAHPKVLMTHRKSYLAPYKFPRGIHVLKELPRTATGKIHATGSAERGRWHVPPSNERKGAS